jgi:thiamine transport system ATP-binding protein
VAGGPVLTFEGAVIRNGAFTLAADFTVEPGSQNAVIGPSGAGKSTLLHGIAGFMPVEAGRIVWEGRDISHMAPGARPVSIVFQDQNLFPHLTAFQNVALGVDPAARLDRAQRTAVAAALERVGLAGLGGRKPRELSGGQQSRLALARASVRHRPLLLLDEAFAALGPGLRREMLDLVIAVARETAATLLMVTHDPEDARRASTHTIFVDAGVAAAPRETRELFAAPSPALRAYLGP